MRYGIVTLGWPASDGTPLPLRSLEASSDQFRHPKRRFSDSKICNGAKAVAEQRELPGFPRKRLVKLVRSILWCYGIRPKGEAWTATWRWASAIADSYYHRSWPLASEIASQYVLLLLGQIQSGHGLKLPHRANVMPDSVKRLLPALPVPIPSQGKAKPKRIEQK